MTRAAKHAPPAGESQESRMSALKAPPLSHPAPERSLPAALRALGRYPALAHGRSELLAELSEQPPSRSKGALIASDVLSAPRCCAPRTTREAERRAPRRPCSACRGQSRNSGWFFVLAALSCVGDRGLLWRIAFSEVAYHTGWDRLFAQLPGAPTFISCHRDPAMLSAIAAVCDRSLGERSARCAL